MAGWENGTGFRLLPKRAKAGRVQVLTAGVWLVPGEDPAGLAHQLTHQTREHRESSNTEVC